MLGTREGGTRVVLVFAVWRRQSYAAGIAPLGPWPLRALKCRKASVLPGSTPPTGPGAMPPASRPSDAASFGTGDGAHPISVDCYPMAGHELRAAASTLDFA